MAKLNLSKLQTNQFVRLTLLPKVPRKKITASNNTLPWRYGDAFQRSIFPVNRRPQLSGKCSSLLARVMSTTGLVCMCQDKSTLLAMFPVGWHLLWQCLQHSGSTTCHFSTPQSYRPCTALIMQCISKLSAKLCAAKRTMFWMSHKLSDISIMVTIMKPTGSQFKEKTYGTYRPPQSPP